MHLFKYDDPPSFANAAPINGYESVTWVEKYADPGEVTIEAKLSSGLREFLPLGSIISRTESLEPMIVENHEIADDVDDEPMLTITGRSFETFLSHRVVGQNQNWVSPPATIQDAGYALAAANLHVQIVDLINDHIYAPETIDDNDAVPNLIAMADVPVPLASVARVIKRGDLHTRVLELLAIGDYGIKVWRANTFAGTDTAGQTRIYIYSGTDKTSTVTFSAQTGDVKTADYLWSIKNLKNAALVTGKFVETFVAGVETGYERRVMFVDASDMDQALTAVPTSTALTTMRANMATRGRQALASQRQITLANVNISDRRVYEYRKDYEVGDFVSLDGNFGETLRMRVVAYAEIEDKDGETGYPTLSVVDV